MRNLRNREVGWAAKFIDIARSIPERWSISCSGPTPDLTASLGSLPSFFHILWRQNYSPKEGLFPRPVLSCVTLYMSLHSIYLGLLWLKVDFSSLWAHETSRQMPCCFSQVPYPETAQAYKGGWVYFLNNCCLSCYFYAFFLMSGWLLDTDSLTKEARQ